MSTIRQFARAVLGSPGSRARYRAAGGGAEQGRGQQPATLPPAATPRPAPPSERAAPVHSFDNFHSLHQSISPFQKIFLAGGSAVGAFANPLRGDLVAVFGDVTAHAALHRTRQRMAQCEEGRELLARRPVVSNASLCYERLRQLPPDTFGSHYIRWMDSHAYEADGRPTVQYIDDEELAYVMLRYRQTHDFWHVLLGLPPTVLGELVQKRFEYLQTGLPSCAISSYVGPLRLPPSDMLALATRLYPWAAQCSAQCAFLMAVNFERYLDHPLQTVREKLRILPAPPLPDDTLPTTPLP